MSSFRPRSRSNWQIWAATDAVLSRVPAIVGFGAIAFLFVPIIIIVVLSFNADALPRFPVTGWSLDWYASFVDDNRLRSALLNTVILGLVSTIASLVLATFASLGLLHLGRARILVVGLLLAPLLVPGVVFGIALLSAGNTAGVERGWPLLVIGHIVQFLPYAIIVTSEGIRLIDQRYEEAALMLGANYWHAFREVTLPLLRPALIASAMICFVQSLQDFDGSQFWTVPSAETLPVRLYSQTRQALTPVVNVTGVVMLVLPLLALVVAVVLRKLLSPGAPSGDGILGTITRGSD